MDEPLDGLVDALRYPWADGETGVTLVAGGILTLLSPLVVPGLLVLGYGLAVVEAVLDGDEQPPALGPWQDRLVGGLRGAVVLVGYVVLPVGAGLAVLVAYGASAGVGVRPRLFSQAFETGLVFLVLAFLLVGLVLVVAYLAPAALVHLARTGRLGAAFATGDVRRLAAAPSYGAAWLLALAVFAIEAVVLAVLNAAAIGVAVSGFVTFYAVVAMASLFARGTAEAGFDVAVGAEDEGG